jgi:hypothetical protein
MINFVNLLSCVLVELTLYFCLSFFFYYFFATHYEFIEIYNGATDSQLSSNIMKWKTTFVHAELNILWLATVDNNLSSHHFTSRASQKNTDESYCKVRQNKKNTTQQVEFIGCSRWILNVSYFWWQRFSLSLWLKQILETKVKKLKSLITLVSVLIV